MRYQALLFIIILLAPFANVFAQQSNAPNRQIVSGMVLLRDKTAPDFAPILAALPADWAVSTDSVSEKDKTLVFSNGGSIVMLSFMDYALPPADLAAAAEISWLWKNAEAEAPRHKSYVLVSVIGGPNRSLLLHKLFSKVAACVLENTESYGVYQPSQYLLLSKGYYVESAHNMTDTELPVYLWVYFGILQNNGKSSGYTYGLREFGLQEMEINNSSHSIQEVHALIYDTAHEIILNNKRLQVGDIVGGKDKDEKILVGIGPSALIEGSVAVQLAF